MKKVILATALLASGSVLAAGLPTVTKATGPDYLGWYAGAGILGGAQWNSRVYRDWPRGSEGTYRQDSYPWGFTVFMGNRFSPNFGADLNFSWLSTMKYKNLDNTSQHYNVENNYYGFGDGYLYYPIFNYFDLFAKGGIGYIHESIVPKGYDDTTRDTLNTFAINYGAGIGWRYNGFGARAEYTQYKPAQSVDNRYELIDTIGLSLSYTWG